MPETTRAPAVIAAACITLFAGTAGASTLTVLYPFRGGADGALPQASVIYRNGIIFGTTCCGGTPAAGTVFSVNAATGAETQLYSFKGGKDGSEPYAGLVYHDGYLYGTTYGGGGSADGACGGGFGCGVVFKVDPRTRREKVLHRFTGGADGYTPLGGLLYLDGALYGVTANGGASRDGTIYRMNIETGAETVLHGFAGRKDGANPGDTLLAVDGELYGVAYRGGAASAGTVFKFDPSTSAFTVLYQFSDKNDGGYPFGGLIYQGGRLYGTTYFGGKYDLGTAYSVDPATGTEAVLHDFAGKSDGALPTGVVYQDGSLYGLTSGGGSYDAGTLFRLDLKSGAENLLYTFTGGGDGGYPYDRLSYADGAFYGTTYEGGNLQACVGMSCGLVFKFTP
jgi:uncharacterized repeat protein (TIGR03803 family)